MIAFGNTLDLNSWKTPLRLVAIFCVLWGVVATPPLRASVTTPDQTLENNAYQAEHDLPASSEREAARLHTSEITLSRAIDIAMQQRTTARIVDVSFDATSGPPIFRILTTSGSRIDEDHVNASTGKIEASSIFSEMAQLDEVDRQNVRSLLRSNVNLSDAVRIAEMKTSGIAVGAGLLSLNGRLQFGVVVLCGDHLTQVILDPPQTATLR
jgi:hypothetical protein